MVRKCGSKDITGKDTILHVSMKKSQPQMRLPINLNNIIQDIQSRYNINTTTMLNMKTNNGNNNTATTTNTTNYVLINNLMGCKTLFKQLDCLQKFKKYILKIHEKGDINDNNNNNNNNNNKNRIYYSTITNPTQLKQ